MCSVNVSEEKKGSKGSKSSSLSSCRCRAKRMAQRSTGFAAAACKKSQKRTTWRPFSATYYK